MERRHSHSTYGLVFLTDQFHILSAFKQICNEVDVHCSVLPHIYHFVSATNIRALSEIALEQSFNDGVCNPADPAHRIKGCELIVLGLLGMAEKLNAMPSNLPASRMLS